MKNDKSGCVENCKIDDASYLSNNATICIGNCYDDDNLRFVDLERENCVD